MPRPPPIPASSCLNPTRSDGRRRIAEQASVPLSIALLCPVREHARLKRDRRSPIFAVMFSSRRCPVRTLLGLAVLSLSSVASLEGGTATCSPTTFTSAMTLPTTASPLAVTSGDVNDDGHADLVVLHEN